MGSLKQADGRPSIGIDKETRINGTAFKTEIIHRTLL